MSTYGQAPSTSGFANSPAPSYEKINMKPKAKYQKAKGFPPARKKDRKLNVYPAVPPEYPSGALL